ncbi:MAG: hypothetical protein LBK73_02630 [Treponema sp.]|jgi:hypothetical protein|nr:hypothetical protein [Treponema sp.]
MRTEVDRYFLDYNISYANGNSGIAKLTGTMDEGFSSRYASARNTGIYGVLDLQDRTNGALPVMKTATGFESAGKKWTVAQSIPLHWARNAEYPCPAAALGDDAAGFQRTRRLRRATRTRRCSSPNQYPSDMARFTSRW